MSQAKGNDLPPDSPDTTIQAGKGANEDEQTETDELETIIETYRRQYINADLGTMNDTVQTIEADNAKLRAIAALEAWSRKQTVGVLERLKLVQSGIDVVLKQEIDDQLAAAQARVREGQ